MFVVSSFHPMLNRCHLLSSPVVCAWSCEEIFHSTFWKCFFSDHKKVGRWRFIDTFLASGCWLADWLVDLNGRALSIVATNIVKLKRCEMDINHVVLIQVNTTVKGVCSSKKFKQNLFPTKALKKSHVCLLCNLEQWKSIACTHFYIIITLSFLWKNHSEIVAHVTLWWW